MSDNPHHAYLPSPSFMAPRLWMPSLLDSGLVFHTQDVEIGSYPFFQAGKLGVSIVIRSEDQSKIDNCGSRILEFVNEKKIELVTR